MHAIEMESIVNVWFNSKIISQRLQFNCHSAIIHILMQKRMNGIGNMAKIIGFQVYETGNASK